jgi:sugar/nucleoside kinase (ribokinase family)
MPDDAIIADVVLLGHIARDIIVIDDESKPTIGGAVYYGGIAASHMGLKITVITRLSKEDFEILQEFDKYGVKYFAYPSDETTGIKNIYNSNNFEYRECEPTTGFAGSFKKEEILDIETKYFVICPLLVGEVDLHLLEYISEKYHGKICMDMQGFVRASDKDKIYFCNLSEEEQKQILSHVNLLKVDHAEAEALTNTKDIQDAAEILMQKGPEEVLLSHEDGLSLYTKNGSYFFPWKYKQIQGRTGRGDTAFITYVGSRISKQPEDALKFAVALTSLKLEHPGPFTLPINVVEDFIKKEY